MNDPNKTAHGLANLKSNIDSMVHWGQLVVPHSLFSLLISLVVLELHKLCACSVVSAFGLFVRALATRCWPTSWPDDSLRPSSLIRILPLGLATSLDYR
jgi:hypothetical protein